MEVNGREAGFQAYPSAYQRVRRRSRNSTPHIGSGPGGSHRVGSGRGHGGSSEMNLKWNFRESLVLSCWRNLAASGVRSDVTSSGPRRPLRSVARPGRRSVTSSRTSSLSGLAGSLRTSSQGSFDGCFEHPSNQSADCCLPLGERRASPSGSSLCPCDLLADTVAGSTAFRQR
jgi:hypothetical protein